MLCEGSLYMGDFPVKRRVFATDVRVSCGVEKGCAILNQVHTCVLYASICLDVRSVHSFAFLGVELFFSTGVRGACRSLVVQYREA